LQISQKLTIFFKTINSVNIIFKKTRSSQDATQSRIYDSETVHLIISVSIFQFKKKLAHKKLLFFMEIINLKKNYFKMRNCNKFHLKRKLRTKFVR
jgi:hypothetical protein